MLTLIIVEDNRNDTLVLQVLLRNQVFVLQTLNKALNWFFVSLYGDVLYLI